MASTIATKPSHYDVLGLAPTASGEDIARAFAREMSPMRPQPLGGIALVTAAFETLRDPARRRAYDESIGLRKAPPPVPKSELRRDSWPFIASARVTAASFPVADPVPSAPRKEIEQRRPEPVRPPEIQAHPEPVAPQQSYRLPPQPVESELHADGAIDWKRPAMIGGALFLGVAMLGAWVGWEAGNDMEQEPAKQGVTLAVPKARAATATSLPAETPTMADARPERREKPAAAARPRAVRTAPSPEPVLAEAQETEAIQAGEIAEEITVRPAEGDAALVAATPAKLPLPNSVVARTIGRIGYSCGQVASTAAVEGGAPGVFKVTCTSGQSFRAAPVRGRYHFRRWGRD